MPPSLPLLIGLAGGSASGKSTFAEKLVQHLTENPSRALAIERVSTDAYFFPPEQMPTFFSPTQNRDMPDFNQPTSLDLPRLAADLDARKAAGAPDVLIVEGLWVLWDAEIRARLDLRLFLDLDPDTRALRRIVRNLEKQYDPFGTLNSPRAVANYYLESAKVGHERHVEPSKIYADFVLRGDGDFERVARLTAALIHGLLL